MSLFKKKNIPQLHIFLDRELENAKAKQEKVFYYPLYLDEIKVARQWCAQHSIYMDIDHKTDGTLVYKFMLNI